MYLYRIYIMNISSNVICTPNSVNKLNLNLNLKMKHIGAFACIFDMRVAAFFYVLVPCGAPPCQLI
jgi:hypothetical protein